MQNVILNISPLMEIPILHKTRLSTANSAKAPTREPSDRNRLGTSTRKRQLRNEPGLLGEFYFIFRMNESRIVNQSGQKACAAHSGDRYQPVTVIYSCAEEKPPIPVGAIRIAPFESCARHPPLDLGSFFRLGADG